MTCKVTLDDLMPCGRACASDVPTVVPAPLPIVGRPALPDPRPAVLPPPRRQPAPPVQRPDPAPVEPRPIDSNEPPMRIVEQPENPRSGVTLLELFANDSSTLSAVQRAKVVAIARAYPLQASERAFVDGHTSAPADDAYNQRLSEERARAVAAALVEGGWSASQITARGFGERYLRPTDAESRRTYVRVVQPGDTVPADRPADQAVTI